MSKQVYTYHWISGQDFEPEVSWLLSVLEQYAGIQLQRTDSEGWSIGEGETVDLRVNADFFRRILAGEFEPEQYLSQSMCVEQDGIIDELSTAFYYLNCLWERSPEAKKDDWGRSEFEGSVWSRYNLSAPETIVNRMFDRLIERLGIEANRPGRQVFLSHDIDVVYGAWKEDGKAALQQGRLFSFAQILWKHVIGRPTWFNFKEIAQIENAQGYTSTFFWISVMGKVPGIGTNADYSLKDKAIVEAMDALSDQGFAHGIHKSIAASDFSEELGGFDLPITANRYHYLKFEFEHLISAIEEAGLRMDASLGYASVHGYRNGYSLPFVPYVLSERRPARFVEVQLCLMDGTFSKYRKMSGDTAFAEIQSWLKNTPESSVVSILWHNSHFTDFKYRGYPKLYDDLLALLEKQDVECTQPAKLIEEYGNVFE